MTEIVPGTRLAALGLLLLVGCGTAPPPPVAPEPEPEPEELVMEPSPAPQIPIEERIRAPFAVQHEGRVVAREPRPSVAVLDGGAPSPPAAPAPRDTARAAPRPTQGTTPATPTAPASSPTPPRAATAARPAPRQHTVEVGDTFFGIARRYNVTAAALAAVNPGVDRELLRSGQVLQLPAYATLPGEADRAENGQPAGPAAPRAQPPAAPPATRPAQPAAQRPAQQRTHRVAAGETLWGIARRYGVSTEQIRRANRLSDDVVRVGQTLVIPNG